MSVMNGFRAELFDKIVGLNGHAIIQGYDGRLANWEQIAERPGKTPGRAVGASPLIEQPLMASAKGRVEGVLVRGNTVQDIRTNPILNGNVVAGDLKSITPGSGSVAIGARLAETLGAYPGSEITADQLRKGGRRRSARCRGSSTYRVGAIFEVGIYDYDKAFVVMPMEDAQTLLMLGDQVGMVEVEVDDPDKVGEILAPLQPLAGQAMIVDWRSMNSALFEALEVERMAMFVVLCIIILVAVFNILSSLIMLVRAKTRDIAILRTMGASRRALLKIFMTVGVTIGVLGIVAGRDPRRGVPVLPPAGGELRPVGDRARTSGIPRSAS